MNRRDFIKNTGALSLALTVAGPGSLLANDTSFVTPKPFFKLSLAQWSLHRMLQETHTLNNMEFAKKAHRLGFDGIEYVSTFYPLEQGNLNRSVQQLVQQLNQHSQAEGITNVLIMVDGEGELAALTKPGRDEAIAKHSKWIDVASGLGCHSIRVNLFGTGAENDFTIWKDTAADGLRRLSELAAKSNINVIVENHGGLSSDAGKLTEVIKNVNLKNCGTLPDFGNFCVKRQDGSRWETPCIEEYDRYRGTRELMPFARGVSAKSYDFDAQGNETTIDYLRMLKIIKDAGYTGHIGVEYEGTRLKEEGGIIATRNLLLKAAAQLG
jgi:sugar phosphate isomerase/epimerase